MKVTFEPLDANDQRIGPFDNVKRAHIAAIQSHGFSLMHDHTLQFADENVTGLTTPAGARYLVIIEEEA